VESKVRDIAPPCQTRIEYDMMTSSLWTDPRVYSQPRACLGLLNLLGEWRGQFAPPCQSTDTNHYDAIVLVFWSRLTVFALFRMGI
jgi:hypothetical protein